MLTRSLQSLVLSTSLCILSGCCVQKRVQDAGFAPVADLSMVQLVSNGNYAYGEDAVVGSIVGYEGMIPGGCAGCRGVLARTTDGTYPPVPFKVALRRGPTVVEKQGIKVKASAVKNTWGDIQLSGDLGHDLELANTYVASMVVNPDDQVPFLARAGGLLGGKNDGKWLLVDRALIADIKNFGTATLKLRYQTPAVGAPTTAPSTSPATTPQSTSARYPVDVNLEGGAVAQLSGPGLLLGVQGWLYEGQIAATINTTDLPGVQTSTQVSVSLADGRTRRLIVSRGADDFVQFADADNVSALVYTLNENGTWRRDVRQASVNLNRVKQVSLAPPTSGDTLYSTDPLSARPGMPIYMDPLLSLQNLPPSFVGVYLSDLAQRPAHIVIVESDNSGRYLVFAITLASLDGRDVMLGYGFTLFKHHFPSNPK